MSKRRHILTRAALKVGILEERWVRHAAVGIDRPETMVMCVEGGDFCVDCGRQHEFALAFVKPKDRKSLKKALFKHRGSAAHQCLEWLPAEGPYYCWRGRRPEEMVDRVGFATREEAISYLLDSKPAMEGA